MANGPEAPEGAELEAAAAAARAQVAAGSWTVDVDVILEDMDVDPPKFQILSYLQNPANGQLVFNNNHRPGFNIHFNLQDPYATGYRFPPNADKAQAVWSQRGNANACPNVGIWEVFTPIRVVQPDCMTLIVYNANLVAEDFGYVLRVTNGIDWKRLDPGGNNQNGPRS